MAYPFPEGSRFCVQSLAQGLFVPLAWCRQQSWRDVARIRVSAATSHSAPGHRPESSGIRSFDLGCFPVHLVAPPPLHSHQRQCHNPLTSTIVGLLKRLMPKAIFCFGQRDPPVLQEVNKKRGSWSSRLLVKTQVLPPRHLSCLGSCPTYTDQAVPVLYLSCLTALVIPTIEQESKPVTARVPSPALHSSASMDPSLPTAWWPELSLYYHSVNFVTKSNQHFMSVLALTKRTIALLPSWALLSASLFLKTIQYCQPSDTVLISLCFIGNHLDISEVACLAQGLPLSSSPKNECLSPSSLVYLQAIPTQKCQCPFPRTSLSTLLFMSAHEMHVNSISGYHCHHHPGLNHWTLFQQLSLTFCPPHGSPKGPTPRTPTRGSDDGGGMVTVVITHVRRR